MRMTIEHSTRYSFDGPVTYGLQQVRKTPKSSKSQTILEWDTSIVGGLKELQFEDHHRNTVELISFEKETAELVITGKGLVEIEDTNGILGAHVGNTPLWLYLKATALTKMGPGVRGILKKLPDGSELERLHSLSDIIRDEVAYKVDSPHTGWTAEDAILAAKGVCQDHTHIFLSASRAMGQPARYVSGYLMLDETTVQDAMHAWAEVYLNGLGWVGFDVSNGISPDARYIRVATGLDYSDAAPVSGSRIGGEGETLNVQISVAQQ